MHQTSGSVHTDARSQQNGQAESQNHRYHQHNAERIADESRLYGVHFAAEVADDPGDPDEQDTADQHPSDPPDVTLKQSTFL